MHEVNAATRSSRLDPPIMTSEVRIEELERQLEGTNRMFELNICFFFLTALHAFAFLKSIPLSFLWDSAIPAWVAAGGIGTLAVWFAWTAKPLLQRVTRAVVVILCVCVIASDAIPYFAQCQHVDFRKSINASIVSGGGNSISVEMMLRQSYFPPQVKTSHAMLGCWLLGAMLAAYCATWFSGYQMTLPCATTNRKPLSIRAILLLTFIAAITSQFVGRSGLTSYWLQFTSGMTSGFLSAGICWGVFQSRLSRRLLFPLGLVLVVMILDATAGWLVGAWNGSVFKRYQHVAIFSSSLIVSPLLTFSLLKHYGYEMRAGKHPD